MGRVRAVEDEIQRAVTEASGFDLVTMGRGEGPRCYCYVNNLLRKSLDTLSKNYDAVVVDNEAGMEHLSRRTTNDVDFLVAVLNPTMPSFRAAKRILELSRQLPVNIRHRVLLVTRVGPNGIADPIDDRLAELDAPRLPDIPQDDAAEQANAVGRDVFSLPEQSPALTSARSIVEELCNMGRG
jgi:CO dehydrogenase maturation factor